MSTEVATLEVELKDSVSKNAGKAQGSLDDLRKSGEASKSKLGGLVSAFKSVGPAIGAIGGAALAGVGAVVGLGLAFKSLGDSLIPLQKAQKAFEIKGGKEGVETLGRIRQFAADAGFELDKATEIAGKLGQRFDPSTAEELFKVIADARGNLGLSEQQVEALTDQLGEMGTKGKLALNDFEGFSKAFGGAAPSFEQIAKATGMTAIQVQKLAEKGELAPQAFVKGFRQAQLELGKTQKAGASALTAAQGDIESQFNRVGSSFQLLKETFAVSLFSGGAQSGLSSLSNALSDLSKNTQVKEALTQLGAALGDLGRQAGPALAKGIQFLIPVFTSVAQSMTKLLGNTALLKGIFYTLGGVVAAAMIPFGALIAASYGLYKAIGFVVDKWDAITGAFSTFGSALAAVGSAIAGFVSGAFNLWIGTIKLFVGLWLGIADIILTPVGGIKGVADAFRSVASVVSSVASSVVSAVGGMVSSVIGFFGSLLAPIASAISNIATTVIGGITNLGSQAFQLGVNMVQGLVNGIVSMAQAPVGAIRDIAQRGINAAKSALGIASPSKVFAEIGGYTAEGFTGGIDDEAATVEQSATSMASTAVDGAQQAVTGLSPSPQLQPKSASGGAGAVIHIDTLNVSVEGIKDLPLTEAGDFFKVRVVQALREVMTEQRAQGV